MRDACVTPTHRSAGLYYATLADTRWDGGFRR